MHHNLKQDYSDWQIIQKLGFTHHKAVVLIKKGYSKTGQQLFCCPLNSVQIWTYLKQN